MAKMSKALQAAHEARARLIEEGGKMERKDPIQKAKENPKSRTLAINAKCWDCQGAGENPGTRWLIGNCPCSDCPLFSVRPFKNLLNSKMPVQLMYGKEDAEEVVAE
jgi:hypothetical protein